MIFTENYYNLLLASKLFAGISENELKSVLSCLEARTKKFAKDETIMYSGDTTNEIGFVLSGDVLVIQDDIWGNRNILSKVKVGESFASVFACAAGATLNVNIIAENDTEILFVNVNKILNVCSSACTHHSIIVRNLLSELAEKNLKMNEKLTHISKRSTRDKLMSYFSATAQKANSNEFDIPFSRQQLADFLAVDRSGLSSELSKMQKEGLIEYNKNHILLKI